MEPSPEETSLETMATLLGCGIDPELSTVFIQSSVPQHSELMWILGAMTPLSWLNKMTQFKEKRAGGDFTSAGLYTYPILMAADILLYQATDVPVGHDQLQHLELSRDIV